MSPAQQKLQIWIGGALNIFKLIGINSTCAQILGKFKKIYKMSENVKNFENFQEKKSNFSLVLNSLARYSGTLGQRFG